MSVLSNRWVGQLPPEPLEILKLCWWVLKDESIINATPSSPLPKGAYTFAFLYEKQKEKNI